MDNFTFPPVEVLVGFVLVFIIGVILGATICLPIMHRKSNIPLEKLSGDWIWRYTPDWILSVLGCVITLILCFILISGMWRM